MGTLNLSEAAREMGCSRSELLEMIHDGQLKTVQDDSGRHHVEREELVRALGKETKEADTRFRQLAGEAARGVSNTSVPQLTEPTASHKNNHAQLIQQLRDQVTLLKEQLTLCQEEKKHLLRLLEAQLTKNE
ncbi:MAG: hypothetical protein HQL54_07735 [Magnetococcales bacterium]|nr:hypothetical protein [Magnetococcales bacterium]